jgi:hypothetical protein
VAAVAVLEEEDDDDDTAVCLPRPRVPTAFAGVGCSSYGLIDSPFSSAKISVIGLGFGSDLGLSQRVTHLGFEEMILALHASLHSWNRPFLCKITFLVLITGGPIALALGFF